MFSGCAGHPQTDPLPSCSRLLSPSSLLLLLWRNWSRSYFESTVESNARMTVNDELDSLWKTGIIACEVLAQYLFIGAGRGTRKTLPPVWESKSERSEYEAELPTCQLQRSAGSLRSVKQIQVNISFLALFWIYPTFIFSKVLQP